MKETVVGLIGGLVGTIVMDLFGLGMFLVMGGPATISFSIIGDAAAGFFSMMGLDMTGGAPLGAVLHYMIGLTLGVIFGAAVSRMDALRVASTKKGVGLGILYVEVMSLPMLATAAIILQMTPSETTQWFGLSFVMHLVYGCILGVVVSRGVHPTLRAVRTLI
jgi:NhaP-type Na+/H+ or K+/H+ antiporter